jgi:hypothetical protein
MNLEPVGLGVNALWFGSGYHRALAAYYEPSTPRSPNVAMMDWTKWVFEWYDSLDTVSIEVEQIRDELLNLGHGMLNHYHEWARKNDAFDVLWVEREFEVGIPGIPGVSYSFKCDAFVVDRHNRGWIGEWKTAASFPGSTDYLLNDDQPGTYLWGMMELGLPEIEMVEGVLYTMHRKKIPAGLRPLVRGGFSVNKTQDTTFDYALKEFRFHFGKSIPRDYWDFLNYLKLKGNTFFLREHVRRNRREIANIGTALKYEVLDMINSPSIYRTPGRINCNGCPYFVPCLIKWEGGEYESVLRDNYRERVGARGW